MAPNLAKPPGPLQEPVLLSFSLRLFIARQPGRESQVQVQVQVQEGRKAGSVEENLVLSRAGGYAE